MTQAYLAKVFYLSFLDYSIACILVVVDCRCQSSDYAGRGS
jgi:hypothetical protein